MFDDCKDYDTLKDALNQELTFLAASVDAGDMTPSQAMNRAKKAESAFYRQRDRLNTIQKLIDMRRV